MTCDKGTFIAKNCEKCMYGLGSGMECPWFVMGIPVFVGDDKWNESVRQGNPIKVGDDYEFPDKCMYLKARGKKK